MSNSNGVPVTADFDSLMDNAESNTGNSNEVAMEAKVSGFVADQNNSINTILRSLDNKGYDDATRSIAISKIAEKLGLENVSIDEKPFYFVVNNRTIKCDVMRFEGKDAIELNTEVFNKNGRDQEHQTIEELSDIEETMVLNGQNTYPGIAAVIEGKEKIQVLEGSRRRQLALHRNLTFVVFVTRDPLTEQEAKQIADISRLRKDLSYWENGKNIAEIMASNKEEAANAADGESVEDLTSTRKLGVYLNESHTTVSRYLQAFELPSEFLELIPNSRKLTGAQYIALCNFISKAKSKGAEDIYISKCSRLVNGDDGFESKQLDPTEAISSSLPLMELEENTGLAHLDLSLLPLAEQQCLIIELLKEVKVDMFDRVVRNASQTKLSKNALLETKGKGARTELVVKFSNLYKKGADPEKVKLLESKLKELVKELGI
ncbi:hypothetical protein [Vibrio sp. THAF190c]|jgi:hypothetical protein|uniref:hypothetical protein n=1 Tax=Vibrio sp. THAF190c TaxID=2587865 RepID=UPI0012696732|nr:hypothetical protein [Vibrio sp. THAF190c]QFT13383.1 Virulence regulon transcriptional activator VirB [Vibrio sp. THAF190c]